MHFLTDQFDTGLQYRTVNTIRSAISMTHPEIEGTAVGSHPLVSRLLKGMFIVDHLHRVTRFHGM